MVMSEIAGHGRCEIRSRGSGGVGGGGVVRGFGVLGKEPHNPRCDHRKIQANFHSNSSRSSADTITQGTATGFEKEWCPSAVIWRLRMPCCAETFIRQRNAWRSATPAFICTRWPAGALEGAAANRRGMHRRLSEYEQGYVVAQAVEKPIHGLATWVIHATPSTSSCLSRIPDSGTANDSDQRVETSTAI
jgi:hypothetical protein